MELPRSAAGVPTGESPWPGLLVSFEGGEGSGKSSQVRLVAQRLRECGRTVVETFEPGGTELGRQLRHLLLDSGSVTPRAEALLFAADRAHHVATVVLPAMQRGDIVLTDRFISSSLAYQAGGRVLADDEILQLSRWATEGLLPDLTVLLDLDPAVGLARALGRSGAGADRLEREALTFHERVRAAFLDQAGQDRWPHVVLDATRPPEAIAGQVVELVEAELARRVWWRT